MSQQLPLFIFHFGFKMNGTKPYMYHRRITSNTLLWGGHSTSDWTYSLCTELLSYIPNPFYFFNFETKMLLNCSFPSWAQTHDPHRRAPLYPATSSVVGHPIASLPAASLQSIPEAFTFSTPKLSSLPKFKSHSSCSKVRINRPWLFSTS